MNENHQRQEEVSFISCAAKEDLEGEPCARVRVGAETFLELRSGIPEGAETRKSIKVRQEVKWRCYRVESLKTS